MSDETRKKEWRDLNGVSLERVSYPEGSYYFVNGANIDREIGAALWEAATSTSDTSDGWREETLQKMAAIQAERRAMIQDEAIKAFTHCPTCGGDLDTGWECTQCQADWEVVVAAIKGEAAPASPCRESAYGHISKQAEAEDPVRSVDLADGWRLEWLSNEVYKLSNGRSWVAISATAGQAIAKAVATRADCDRANRKVLILLSTLKKISEKLKDYGDAQRDLGNIEVAQDFAEARILTIPNDYNLAAKLHEMETDREEGTE